MTTDVAVVKSRGEANRVASKIARDAKKIAAELIDQNTLKNGAESLFAFYASAKGMTAYRGGWPDFFVVDKHGSFKLIEVKAKNDRLRSSQKKLFAAMERAGLSVWIWSNEFPRRLFKWREFERRRRELRASWRPPR